MNLSLCCVNRHDAGPEVSYQGNMATKPCGLILEATSSNHSQRAYVFLALTLVTKTVRSPKVSAGSQATHE